MAESLNPADELTIVIQAGGRSRRMGQDKALLPLEGQPLIQRLAQRMLALRAPLFVLARQTTDYAFLKVPVYTDTQPGLGPLGGFLTAFQLARTPFVAMLACDMPFASPSLLLNEWQTLRRTSFHALVPDDGQPQPFHAVYSVEACQPSLQASLARDERKLLGWLGQLQLCPFPCAPDPAFTNLNTPDDLRKIEQMAGNLTKTDFL